MESNFVFFFKIVCYPSEKVSTLNGKQFLPSTLKEKNVVLFGTWDNFFLITNLFK